MKIKTRPVAREAQYEHRSRSWAFPETHCDQLSAPALSPASIPWSWEPPWPQADWDGRWSASGTDLADCCRPERYPEGGLVTLSPELVENLDPAAGGILGQAAHVDPFHVRTVNKDDMVEELDLSDLLLKRLEEEKIDALISIVGGRGLSIFHKLHRKGLNTVCVPRSIENDIAATMVSFGFNSALTFTIEMLDRVRQAAQSARKIAVVEVLGAQSGLAGAPGGHRRVRRCRAHPRDSRQPSIRGRKIEGKSNPPAALRAGRGGGRGQV